MAAPQTSPRRRSTRIRVKQEEPQGNTSAVKPSPSPIKRKRAAAVKQEAPPTPSTPLSKRKRIKTEPGASPSLQLAVSPPTSPDSKDAAAAAVLQERKLKSFSSFASRSPFPAFAHPTPDECRLAHKILADIHGDRARPEKVVAPTQLAGCGNSPSVLDALVRTILSQNTSDKNSSRAKLAMDATYGGSDRWDAIARGGQAKLQESIKSGGLSVVKSKVIISILEQVYAKYGVYSLDHLFDAEDDEAMREMLSFHGVGPKTASCVLLFCLQRASFAVDTHVYRLTGLLGWRPPSASREEAQAHLDAVVPAEEKYPLHVLFISHGKNCAECKAGGKNAGKCALRKAFKKGRVDDEVMAIAKKEEEEEEEKA